MFRRYEVHVHSESSDLRPKGWRGVVHKLVCETAQVNTNAIGEVALVPVINPVIPEGTIDINLCSNEIFTLEERLAFEADVIKMAQNRAAAEANAANIYLD